jgi:predicted metalloprotease with PDZ domain
MYYRISYSNPQSHYIEIEFTLRSPESPEVELQLPAWRPGRYELGNFAKNIQKWAAFDENDNKLEFRKVKKDRWIVHTGIAKEVRIRYTYYAAELNAGSTFLDETQLYMNPVNCCLCVPGRLDEKCQIEIIVPESYQVATGMKKVLLGNKDLKDGFHRNVFEVASFHELADSPFIASPSLQHNMFVMDGVEYHIWFQGESKPDWPRIINDFFIFINEQCMMMKEFPAVSYHFLFQVLPFRFHHGVEHLNSTVIAVGPSYSIMQGEGYEDFLGVSSHELFHAWNIKSIRPVEMQPYDYSQENYSRQGFVYEGVTTYYGDIFLFRSGVFNEDQYFSAFRTRVQKHFDNPGRFNLSVADSSFDTWLDGYIPGIPNRKTNIYDEGCLTAFMTDILIRQHTGNQNTLDDVMRLLYFQHAKNDMGYSEQDYLNLVSQVAGQNLSDFFRKYIYGTEEYTQMLKFCLDYVGLDLLKSPASKTYERHLGIKVIEQGNLNRITNVYPGSVSDTAGLRINDEIISINGLKIQNDLDQWCTYFKNQSQLFFVNRAGEIKVCKLVPLKEEYYPYYQVRKQNSPSLEQKDAYQKWCKRAF